MPWLASVTALKLRALMPGDIFAPHQLGAIYATGDRVPTNLTAAKRWYELGARRGDPESQYDLGFMYLLGEGTAPAPDLGLKWLESASNSGHLQAARLLADLFSTGSLGVQRSDDSAQRWLVVAQH